MGAGRVWSGVSIVCAPPPPPAMRIRDLTTGSDRVLPLLPHQNMADSTRFSPFGAWLAYAAARGDPMDETGRVAMASSDGMGGPQVVDAMLLTGRGWETPPMPPGYQMRFVAM